VSRRPAILAVDGGGSKLDAALVRRDGTLLGAARIRTSGWAESGDDSHMGQVVFAAQAACRDAGIDPQAKPFADLGVYCLAGADLPADDRRIARWLRRAALTSEDLVRNDTFAVLRAGTDRDWGIGVVCGYGTNCCGVAPDGKVLRFPAVGEISGDWGGGVDIGRLAAVQAIRAEDGRGRKTILKDLVSEYFGFKRPRQLMEAVYFDRLPVERLVELAPTVFEAAKAGDEVATDIVWRQADEIVTMAGTAIRRLKMTKLDVNVVLGGGIFRNNFAGFFDRIHQGLQVVAPASSMKVLDAPPVLGAALLGLDTGGLTGPARLRLSAALTHQRLGAHTQCRRSQTPKT
jgi:N-acetylglucosamine kinase-like BadF-type ATPase